MLLALKPQKRTIADVLPDYADYLKMAYSESHARNLLIQIKGFIRETGVSGMSELHFRTITGYLSKLKIRGLSNWTISAYLQAVSIFCRWLVDMDYLSDNSVARIKRPRPDLPPVVYYSSAQLDRILATAAQIDRRLHDLLLIIRYTGLRHAEALGLRAQDIDLSARTITVVRGKGGKTRRIPICDTLLAALPDIMPESGYLFTGRTGGHQTRISQGLVYQWVSKLKTQLPDIFNQRLVGTGASLHGLRSSFATECARHLNTTEGLRLLQEWLGHSDLRTLPRYIAAASGYNDAIESVFSEKV
jgi:integrase/recombinase XerC